MGIKCTWKCLLSLFEKLDIAQVDYEMSINLLFSVNSVEKKKDLLMYYFIFRSWKNYDGMWILFYWYKWKLMTCIIEIDHM